MVSSYLFLGVADRWIVDPVSRYRVRGSRGAWSGFMGIRYCFVPPRMIQPLKLAESAIALSVDAKGTLIYKASRCNRKLSHEGKYDREKQWMVKLELEESAHVDGVTEGGFAIALGCGACLLCSDWSIEWGRWSRALSHVCPSCRAVLSMTQCQIVGPRKITAAMDKCEDVRISILGYELAFERMWTTVFAHMRIVIQAKTWNEKRFNRSPKLNRRFTLSVIRTDWLTQVVNLPIGNA